jgi:hypothetical protein
MCPGGGTEDGRVYPDETAPRRSGRDVPAGRLRHEREPDSAAGIADPDQRALGGGRYADADPDAGDLRAGDPGHWHPSVPRRELGLDDRSRRHHAPPGSAHRVHRHDRRPSRQRHSHRLREHGRVGDARQRRGHPVGQRAPRERRGSLGGPATGCRLPARTRGHHGVLVQGDRRLRGAVLLRVDSRFRALEDPGPRGSPSCSLQAPSSWACSHSLWPGSARAWTGGSVCRPSGSEA